jgi:ribosomal protein L34E
MWISSDYARCPRCGNLLRSVPRNSPLKNSRKYTLDEARQIFERFLSRGYTVEEAVEAIFALTGIRPEVRTDAEA